MDIQAYQDDRAEPKQGPCIFTDVELRWRERKGDKAQTYKVRARAKLDTGATGPAISDRLIIPRIKRHSPIRIGGFDGTSSEYWYYTPKLQMRIGSHRELISFDIIKTPPNVDIYLPV